MENAFWHKSKHEKFSLLYESLKWKRKLLEVVRRFIWSNNYGLVFNWTLIFRIKRIFCYFVINFPDRINEICAANCQFGEHINCNFLIPYPNRCPEKNKKLNFLMTCSKIFLFSFRNFLVCLCFMLKWNSTFKCYPNIFRDDIHYGFIE